MSQNIDEWKPMESDFSSISFNSYSRGPGAQLPLHLLPSFSNKFRTCLKTQQNFKLFIDGFSSDLTETGLKNFLQSIGCNPLRVKIVHSSTRLGKPFSFVDFSSGKEATKAIELINNQKTLKKLFVSFASTESENQKKEFLIDKEKEQNLTKLETNSRLEMRPKITIENNSISNSNGNSISPIPSDNGSGVDTSLCEAISSLANCNKLIKVLQKADADCSYCNETSRVDHLHFIISEQQVLDPTHLPELIEMNVSCVVCGKNDGNLKLCSQCKTATYCSRRCQSSNWPKHRQTCKPNVDPISQLNSIDTERSVNSILKNELEAKTKTGLNSVKSKVIETPILVNNREPPKESTPLTIDVNLSRGDISVLNESSTQPKSSPLLQISNDSIDLNKSSSSERSNLSASYLNSIQTKSNRVIHKIVPFRGDLLFEELKDGEEDVVICFGRDPNDFYLNKDSSEEKMSVFFDKLNEKVDELPQLSDKDLKVGSFCGGIYSADGVCYRAKVVDKIDENTYALLFVDYGNIEPVKVKDMKALPPIFFDCRAQAIRCTLNNVVPTGGQWDINAIKFFGDLGETRQYSKVRLFQKTKEGIHKIDLIDKNGNSLINDLIERKFASHLKSSKYSGFTNDEIRAQQTYDKSIRSPRVSPQVTPKKNNEGLSQFSPKVTFNYSSLDNFKVDEIRNDSESNGKMKMISYLDSLPNKSKVEVLITFPLNEEFQYWGITNTDKYHELSKKLESEYSSSAIECIPRKGDIVVVKSSDGEYCRAYIIGVSDKVANVIMIDAGNCEEVTHIYKMSSKYAKIPSLSVLLFPKTKAEKVILELTATKQVPHFEGTLIKRDDGMSIKIGDEMIDALDYKSAVDLVLKQKEKIDFYSQLSALKLPLNTLLESLVLFQEKSDPNVFYVAGNDDRLSHVMSLSAQLSLTFTDDKSVKPTVGNVYLAKSSDGDWYRAVVISVESDKCQVLFVDFGNVDDIEAKFVMNLSPDLELSSSPAVAVKCKVESSDMKAEEVHKKIEQAVDGTYLLKIEALKYEDGIHYVRVD